MNTQVCSDFGLEFPIFAFSHCRDVVAAVSRAGGMGVLGALAFTPEQLEQELAWIDEHVDGKPYGVDIVIPAKYVGKGDGGQSKTDLEHMISERHRAFISQLLQRYEIPELPDAVDRVDGLLGWSAAGGRAHVEVAMRHPIKLLVNALGPPPPDVIETAHAAGVKVGALIGRVDQALKQKEAGVDLIIASGHEAGGHTGEITTMVLVPQVVDAVAPVPVLAAGGIGNGRQMLAAMALGAQGVWTGSLWLTVHETDVIDPLKEKLLRATSSDTIRSRCISGKPARQLKTDYTKAWEGTESPGMLPMPLQMLATMDATQRIHKFAETGHAGACALVGTPVGQVVGQMNTPRATKDVIFDMVAEYVESLQALQEALGSVDAD